MIGTILLLSAVLTPVLADNTLLGDPRSGGGLALNVGWGLLVLWGAGAASRQSHKSKQGSTTKGGRGRIASSIELFNSDRPPEVPAGCEHHPGNLSLKAHPQLTPYLPTSPGHKPFSLQTAGLVVQPPLCHLTTGALCCPQRWPVKRPAPIDFHLLYCRPTSAAFLSPLWSLGSLILTQCLSLSRGDMVVAIHKHFLTRSPRSALLSHCHTFVHCHSSRAPLAFFWPSKYNLCKSA